MGHHGQQLNTSRKALVIHSPHPLCGVLVLLGMILVLLLLLGLLLARSARGTRVVAPARVASFVQARHRRLMCTIAAVGGAIGGRPGLRAAQALVRIPCWTPALRCWLLVMALLALHAVDLASSTSRCSSTGRRLSLRLWLAAGRLRLSRVVAASAWLLSSLSMLWALLRLLLRSRLLSLLLGVLDLAGGLRISACASLAPSTRPMPLLVRGAHAARSGRSPLA